MTTNGIRCQLISRILRMDRGALLSLQAMMDKVRTSGLPAELPEWMTATEAADLLHLTPRHVRRLAKTMLPGLMCLRPSSTRGQLKAWHIHRDLVRSIADAPRCAKHAPVSEAKS